MRRLIPILALIAALTLGRAPTPAIAQAADGWQHVTQLIVGDTVDFESGKGVPMFGINTLERGERCFDEATEVLRGFLIDNGRDYWVYLEYGPRRIDLFGRLQCGGCWDGAGQTIARSTWGARCPSSHINRSETTPL
jgi:hypothetical protein